MDEKSLRWVNLLAGESFDPGEIHPALGRMAVTVINWHWVVIIG